MATLTLLQLLHLHRRATFGLPLAQLSKWQSLSRTQAIQRLLDESAQAVEVNFTDEDAPKLVDLAQMDKAQRREALLKSRRYVRQFGQMWYTHLITTPAQLREKMTLFWHGHFATQPRSVFAAQGNINTLRKYALGKFGDLLLAVARDPAMLAFLNNQQNRKNAPNENFARELMELFTLGRGNYSEQDIKEAARAFTGWGFNGDEYVFRQFQHDFGQKTFMGKAGNWNGEDIIRIILEQPQTAKFITAKIYHYLVSDTPLPPDRLAQLAQVFFQSDYNISRLLQEIFNADWFYDATVIGAKIKSPVELLAGLQRSLNFSFRQPDAISFLQRVLGQMLLNPPNVAGWVGGKAWIDSSSLLFRLRLPEGIYRASEIETNGKEEDDVQKIDLIKTRLNRIEATFDWQPIYQYLAATPSREARLTRLAEYLWAVPISQLQETLRKIPQAANIPEQEWLAIALVSAPEYQVM